MCVLLCLSRNLWTVVYLIAVYSSSLSLPLLFLTLLRRCGVSLPFLISCASSLRFSVVFMLLRAQSAPPPPPPPYLCCLKTHPLPRFCISRSYHFLFNFVRPCYRFRYLISVSLSASFFVSFFSLAFSVHPFPTVASLFRPPRSPSVSACSNMATRCPITRLVFATVFPPSYIHRRPRRRKGPHQPPRDTPFHFSAFSFAIVHSLLFIGRNRVPLRDSALVSFTALRTAVSDLRCKLGFAAAKR